MIERARSPVDDREDARAAVRAWVGRIEDAARRREPLGGALMHEYARRMARLRAAEARMPPPGRGPFGS